MNKKAKYDAILVGFGKGFLVISDQIVSQAKQLREELNVEFPRIHIVDHDYDAEQNNVPLQNNEFVIRVYGEERVRCQCEEIEAESIIRELRQVILDNIELFDAAS